MTKENLLQSANSLPTVAPSVVTEYAEKQDQLVTEVNKIMLQHPNLNDLIGAGNIEVMKTNHSNHAKFVASIFEQPNPEILVDSLLWVFRTYRSHGFQPDYFQVEIEAWLNVMPQILSPETFTAVQPLYNWFLVNIPTFTKITDVQLKN